MTREEAARIIKECKEKGFKHTFYTLEEYHTAIDMAIKALEQEPVLDKIRAEIEEKFEGCDICEWFEDYDYDENDISEYRSVGSIDEVLQIIDKYRAERISEE